MKLGIGIPGHTPPARPMDAEALRRRATLLGTCFVQIVDNLPLHTVSDAESNTCVPDQGLKIV